MSDFEEKLNAILSNPEAMGQVMQLAQSLDLSGGNAGAPPPQAQPPAPPTESSPLSVPGDLLGGIDPGMIRKLLPLLGELQTGGNDQRLQLLYALRPFLKPERQDKVEQALRAAKMIHMGKKLLTTMGDLHV